MSKKISAEDPPVTDDNRVSIVTWPQTCVALRDVDPLTWPTSLEPGSARWKAALVNAQTAGDYDLSAGEVVEFVATDWLVHWTSAPDEKTGLINEFSQIVLLGADGSLVKTSSEVVAHQLARVLQVFTVEEWRAGIRFQLRGRVSRRGRGYHELRVL